MCCSRVWSTVENAHEGECFLSHLPIPVILHTPDSLEHVQLAWCSEVVTVSGVVLLCIRNNRYPHQEFPDSGL